jgi:ABC-2 type transport system permease protein
MTITPTLPAATPGVAGCHDVWVITRRNIKRIVRTPQLLAFASIQPVIFVILFRYVFGGAIHAPGMSYADYLMPGIFVESMLFGTTTAVALATDLRSGIVDRFRSLPISRAASCSPAPWPISRATSSSSPSWLPWAPRSGSASTTAPDRRSAR